VRCSVISLAAKPCYMVSSSVTVMFKNAVVTLRLDDYLSQCMY